VDLLEICLLKSYDLLEDRRQWIRLVRFHLKTTAVEQLPNLDVQRVRHTDNGIEGWRAFSVLKPLDRVRLAIGSFRQLRLAQASALPMIADHPTELFFQCRHPLLKPVYATEADDQCRTSKRHILERCIYCSFHLSKVDFVLDSVGQSLVDRPMDGFFSPAPPRSELSLAVESLCRRYDTWFRGVLRRRYGDQADDLAQEAYLRTAAHEAGGKVRHPKAFLLNVANNLATDRRRRELRENAYASYRGAFPTQSTAATQEMAVTLKQIMLALPPELRDCLIMSRVHGQTHGEIALQLGLTQRTVKDRVRRASILVAAAMQD